jgi:putative NIF3 family GTP cyclohydrolase 1 type 2
VAVGDLATFARHVEARLGRAPLVIGDPGRAVRRIAWCTGAAQGYFETAIGLGVDVYLTGEISEQHVHLARESDVAFVAAGHHATERFGVQAVGEHLAQTFGLHHRFIDVPSPV